MAKGKPPSPQEMYRARKQREEAERDALLPPGLINNGNTCFMNSVMQGLIATRTLESFAHFRPLPPSIEQSTPDISPHRSPLMTNGRGRGGEYEKVWEEGMPLGDIFMRIMEKAWDMEQQKTRQSFSPKELLTALGKKYDQYLDFRQQDAHEYYCHLLDAMRMEEIDIIKKRQPLPKKRKPRRSAESKPAAAPAASSSHSEPRSPEPSSQAVDPDTSSTSTPPIPEEIPVSDRLTPFVDMLFTGQLASILVCENCKKVSHTYEDFIDLSLPLKAEDLVNERARKRDRLKTFAQRLRKRSSRHTAAGPEPTTSTGSSNGARAGQTMGPPSVPPVHLPPGLTVRSTSVPPSPTRRSSDLAVDGETEPSESNDVRRRSLDVVQEGTSSLRNLIASATEEGESKPESEDDTTSLSAREIIIAPTPVIAQATPPPVIVAPPLSSESSQDSGLSVGEEVDLAPLPRVPSPVPQTSKRDSDGWFGRRFSVRKVMEGKDGRGRTRGSKGDVLEANKIKSSSPRPTSPSPPRRASLPVNEYRPSSARVPDHTSSSKPPSPPSISSAPVLKHGATSSTPTATDDQSPFTREASASSMTSLTLPPAVVAPAVLTTSPATSHPNAKDKEKDRQWKSPKPNAEEAAYLRRILSDAIPASGSGGHFSLFSKPGTPITTPSLSPGPALPFTANLWNKLGPSSGIEDCLRMFTAVEALDGENMVGCRRCWKLANGVYKPKARPPSRPASEKGSDSDVEANDAGDESHARGKSNSHVRMPAGSSPSRSGMNTPVSVASESPSCFSFDDLGEAASITTTVHSDLEKTLKPNGSIYGGQIPSISTTAPDPPNILPPDTAPTGPSTATLLAPQTQFNHRLTKNVKGYFDHEDTTSSDSDSSDSDDDASDATDASSAAVSPSASPRMEREPSPRIPRSKQIILQRAYKRYLISTPPPVLVIHLKRFQQTSKYPMSFSTGFKKLDDSISFPEYFDVTPFLAPKREDFRHAKTASKAKKDEEKKCMYRLYAVVVHIGNMLGGHYVAYTALPSPTSSTATPVLHSPAASDATNHHHFDHKEARPPRQWAYISDAVVRLTSLEEVLKAKAYLCLYEKL